jgi:hypothetical protein
MKRIAYAALVALSAALMSGCGKDMNNPVAPVANESNTRTSDQFSVERTRAEAGPLASNTFGFGVSRILFVHASPDAPAVDINLGIQPVARDLVFANNTPYRYTWSGPRRVLVNVANTSTNVINAMATLSPWTFYSVFATGTVADLKPLVLVDDLRSPARGKAHVRFVHLSPNAPAVDVALAGGGAVVFGNKAFREYTAFTPLDAGTYDLEVRVAGTNTVALPLPGVTLQAGKIYTVYAKGLLGGTGAQALGAGVIVNSDVARSWARFSGTRTPIDMIQAD